MIALGTTLRCNLPPRHLWVVISDPARTGDPILLVSLTSLTEDCVDDGCILNAGDFTLLNHATVVAYSRAQIGTVAKLEGLIQQGAFSVVTMVTAATLNKILVDAQRSRELSASQRELVG